MPLLAAFLNSTSLQVKESFFTGSYINFDSNGFKIILSALLVHFRGSLILAGCRPY